MKRFPKTLTGPERHESVLDESRILVAFKEPIKTEEVQNLARDLNLTVETGKKEEGKHWIQINHTNQRYWLRSLDGSPIDDQEFSRIKKAMETRLDWIGPVYRSANTRGSDDCFCPLPNVLLLRRIRQEALNQLIEGQGLKINELKSKYLTAYYYLELEDPEKANAYEVRQKLEKQAGEVLFENMPMYKPLTTTIPNDTWWANQWDMTQINAPNGWDISSGSSAVVICILDEGCDLLHPDLQFSGQGINLGTMLPTGAPTGNHGTACAGIAAGTFNNSAGVAGVAGGCLILPLAFQNWSDVECANGINYATANGADVISMSFGVYAPGEGPTFGWVMATIDPEVQNAFTNDVVMCAATGNENRSDFNRYPGRHPLVIGVGGSSTDDNRKTPTSPDGECWGANFGEDVYGGVTTGVSVVAPCVQCPTTDRQGSSGYNNNGTLSPNPWACVNYPMQPADGNFVMVFDGTSAATPHVAGLAGLLKSQYPTLTNLQIRNIIERTTAKVGTVAYAEQAGFPNGTRNQEMGYGRIDIFQALDFADVMIRDWSGDTGIEPSTSGNFWDFSDIVVRINDDNVFNPSNPSQSKNVERGQPNFIYVQVTNNGPRDATNVVVNVRITPYVGLQFVYPNDWTAVDGMHVSPVSLINNFAVVPAGTSVIAKFSIDATQVETLYGWENSNPWHPCLLAQVTADNDYAYASSDLSLGNVVVRKNNFAQRNLSVIDVLASAGAPLSLAFPFVVGNLFAKARTIRLHIDRSKLPEKATVRLNLAENGNVFPRVDFTQTENPEKSGIVFRDKTRFTTRIGCCDALVTLEKGSILELLCAHEKLQVRNIRGGELVVDDGERLINITGKRSVIEFDSQQQTIYPLSVQIDFPGDIKKGDEYALVAYQTDEGNRKIGGATTIYNMK
jgi:hypothetical protein